TRFRSQHGHDHAHGPQDQQGVRERRESAVAAHGDARQLPVSRRFTVTGRLFGGDDAHPAPPLAAARRALDPGAFLLLSPSPPPVRRLTRNTSAANTRVTTARTTPIAVASPNCCLATATLNRRWLIVRVELSGPPFGTIAWT